MCTEEIYNYADILFCLSQFPVDLYNQFLGFCIAFISCQAVYKLF